METFEQIRDKVAKQLYGNEDYKDCLKSIIGMRSWSDVLIEIDNINREAAKEFAEQAYGKDNTHPTSTELSIYFKMQEYYNNWQACLKELNELKSKNNL